MRDRAGLIVIQIDGMSRPAIDEALARGRMPALARLMSDGRMTLDDWTPLLPSCTPASQAGILHGANEGIPGFRWLEKATGRLMVANHPGDAAELERRLSNGGGLLAVDGVSVGNLLAGDAAYSHLTMATLEGGIASVGGYPLRPFAWVRISAAMVREALDEVVQSRRQRLRGERPRMRRGWRFGLERVITNVPLRILSTAMVIHEVHRGRPIIYVDYTGYDEIAHHCGPGRPETHDAAQKIDRSIGHILDAVARGPHAYELVVLSDHGQSLGATFRQRFGMNLVELIAGLIGEGTTFDSATPRAEYAGGIGRLGRHLLGGRVVSAVEGLSAHRPGSGHHRFSRIADGRGAPLDAPADAQIADVVVCGSGNLGLVYLTALPGRLTREQIDGRYPGLIDALVRHPGLGMVVVRMEDGCTVAIGAAGTHDLDHGRVVGDDPLAGYEPTALTALLRLADFENVGDLIVIGRYDPLTEQVVSIEELIGSHGGLGGRQTRAFIAHPTAWRLDEELVGAPAVHAQLRRWLAAMAEGAPTGP